MMPDSDDERIARLLQAAQQGDSEAFGQLYESYAQQVFRYLYAHLDERMDAEDLTGEVFLRVWRALPQYQRTEAPFGGFLFRVARNALYDHYRRNRSHRAYILPEDDRMAERASDPAESHLQDYEHQHLRRILSKLPEEQRSVLTLRFLAGLSPEETAQAMGKSNGAVRVLQHRALYGLRKILLKESDDQKRK
jgi:RNA polymerase sigma-70 factor (ECF subfamily)